MTANGWIQILFFFARHPAPCTKPLGAFMHRVLEGERHFLPAAARLAGAARLPRWPAWTGDEQSWQAYSRRRCSPSALFTHARDLRHPAAAARAALQPAEAAARSRPASSFNTAASFTTNTNWQGYVGEATMSYLSQMAGLAWHNFISAAAGIAIAIALARGLTRRATATAPGTIGNFWVDLTRATVYVLLPLCSSSPSSSSRRA